MTSWQLSKGRVVGAVAPPDGSAPFHRAPLVFESIADSDQLLEVRRYSDDNVEGQTFTRDEWRARIDSGEAIPLAIERAPVRDLWLWLFRRNFVLEREAVLQQLAEGLLVEPRLGKANEVLCFVIETQRVALRDAWASESSRRCEEALQRRDATEAIRAAETAFNLERVATPQSFALLAMAFRLAGRETRAEGYERSARHSMGDAFAHEVEERIARLQGHCDGLRALRGKRPDALANAPMIKRPPPSQAA